jgi:hypothetical protein
MSPTIHLEEDRRESGRQTCERLELMEERLAKGDERMDRMEKTQEELAESVSKVLEIVQMAEGFFKVLGHLGTAIKFVGTTVAAIAGLWYLFKGK